MSNQTTHAYTMDASLTRAIAMTNLGYRGGGSPNAEYMAAVNAVDADQRSYLNADHPAFLPRSAAEDALAAFVALVPPPPPDYSHCATASEIRSVQGLRAPVMGVSVSHDAVYLAQREGFSPLEAEAVVAHLKHSSGNKPNTLLARQVINRYADANGIRFKDAEAALYAALSGE